MTDSLARNLEELKSKLEANGVGRLFLAAKAEVPHESEIRAELSSMLAMRLDWDLPEGLAARWSESGFEREEGLRARGALLQAVRELGQVVEGRVGASIAHGGGFGVAAVRTKKEGTARIGIDIETEARPVPERVYRRFCHPDELRAGVAPIEWWCLKEAVFKLGTTGNTPYRAIRVELEEASGMVRLGHAEWPVGRALVGLACGSGVRVAVACGI